MDWCAFEAITAYMAMIKNITVFNIFDRKINKKAQLTQREARDSLGI